MSAVTVRLGEPGMVWTAGRLVLRSPEGSCRGARARGTPIPGGIVPDRGSGTPGGPVVVPEAFVV